MATNIGGLNLGQQTTVQLPNYLTGNSIVSPLANIALNPMAAGLPSASTGSNTGTVISNLPATTTNVTTPPAANLAQATQTYTPTAEALAGIRPTSNQNRTIGAGQVIQSGKNYLYVDPLTGIQMSTPIQDLANYQANKSVADYTPDALTSAQLSGIQKATDQNRDIAPGQVVYNSDSGNYLYRDGVTGVVMKTKDLDAAYTQAHRTVQPNVTTDASGNVDISGATVDPRIGSWTLSATNPSGFSFADTDAANALNDALIYNDINNLKPIQQYYPLMEYNPYGSTIDYADYLRSLGYTQDNLISGQNPYLMAFGNIESSLPTGQFGANYATQDPFKNYRAFTYGDKNLQNAINWLDERAKNNLYTPNPLGVGQYTPTLNASNIDPNLRQYITGKDSVGVGYGGVSYLDAMKDPAANTLLAQTAKKFGVSVDDLKSAYGRQFEANSMFADPTSGAHWADLMTSGAAQDIISGVGAFTGTDKKIVFDTNKTITGLTADSGPIKSGDKYYFINPTTGQTQYTTDAKTADLISTGQATGNTMLDIANSMAGTRPIAKEYTDKDFGVTAENPVKEIKDSTGTTYYAVFNKDTGTQFIATDRDAADKLAAGDSGLRLNANTDTYYDTNEGALNAAYTFLAKPSEQGTFTNVNKAMKWNDFLPTGVSVATATPQQISDAKAAFAGQKELMGTWIDPTTLAKDVGTVKETNKFNLTADSPPERHDGKYYFVNDQTGKVTTVKDADVANWASDTTKNQQPLQYKGEYYYLDSEGNIKKTSNPTIAQGAGEYSNYLSANKWQQFLPDGVKESNATSEQINKAKTDFSLQQEVINQLTGPGSVFNLFKSEQLPIPKDFYYDPNDVTRKFNTLANLGINPSTVRTGLSPENVYKESLEYDAPDGGFGGFVGSFIVPALSLAYPGLGPILQGISSVYQLSQGNILGGLTSGFGALSGTDFMKNTFGDLGVGNIANNISSTLQSSFGLSADVAKNVANAGMWAGGNAIAAALQDKNVLQALAEGAGEGYLRNVIDGQLADSITNRGIRNFISGNITNNLMNVLRGGNVNLENLVQGGLSGGFGTLMASDMSKKLNAANP